MRSPEGTSPEPRPGPANLLWLLGLTGLCAVLRLPRLRSLPIFGDEAIYLHCAQLIRESPLQHLWISLQEPTPPFPYWLLAVALPLFSDPLRAGRLLSVLLAVLTLPVFYLLCREIQWRFRRSAAATRSSSSAALFSCALMVFSPYLALSQRMARPEALFILEVVLAGWVSLRLAASAREGTNLAPSAALRGFAARGLPFGLLMGIAMLTRQNFSYILWALPVVSFLFVPAGSGSLRGLLRLTAWLGGSLLVAAVLWIPMLTAETGPDLTTRILFGREFRLPLSVGDRASLAMENCRQILGWLWTYLTPPIALAAAGSFIWLARTRGRLFGFLFSWLALTLFPLVLFATYLFPRYALASTAPLFAAAGVGLAEVWGRVDSVFAMRLRKRLARAAILLLLLPWPARDVLLQIRSWREQTLASIDRWQFVSGWPAGYATQQALAYLKELASKSKRPVVVLTSPDSGNPTDTLWLYGSGDPRLTLYATASLEEPLLAPAAGFSGVYLLRDDLRRGKPARPVRLPPDAPVFYVSRERIYTLQGYQPVEEILRHRNPRIRAIARFENPPLEEGKPGDAVLVFAVR